MKPRWKSLWMKPTAYWTVAPPGDQQLLADPHDLDELGRVESRSTMFPVSLAAEVPVFMATPTSAWPATRSRCFGTAAPRVDITAAEP
jgi:hypothetical protein